MSFEVDRMPAPGRRRRGRTLVALLMVAAVLGTVLDAPRLQAGPITTAAPEPTAAQVPPGCDEVVPGEVQRHGGKPLPASLMLRARDWGRCYVLTADRPGFPLNEPDRGYGSAPDVCLDQAPYAADRQRVAGRFRTFGGGPEVFGFESVTRYERGAARAFLNQIRARVAKCETFVPAGSPDPTQKWEARIVAERIAGDESMLIRVGVKGADYPGWYIGVARVGNLVVVVEPTFDLGGRLAYTHTMLRRAVARI